MSNEGSDTSAGGDPALKLDPIVYTRVGLYRTLNEALTDGGTVAQEQIASIARYGDELELIFPAYAGLLTWGEPGFQTIVEVASSGLRVKLKSAALTILCGLSVSGQIPRVMIPTIEPSFLTRVNSALDQPAARRLARQFLRQLILATPTDDLLGPVGQAFFHLSTQIPADPTAGEQLVSALSSKWFRLGPKVLDDFEQLMQTHGDDEPAFQQFFCQFPQLLDPMAIHAWSQPDFHGAFEPDFVVRRADDTYLVIEIETPAKPIITLAGQLSAATLQAEKQVFDYVHFLSERVQEARSHFPGFSRAEGMVVIGREGGLTDDRARGLRMANSARQNFRIVGFDWLLQRARTVIENIAEGQVMVTKRHRMV